MRFLTLLLLLLAAPLHAFECGGTNLLTTLEPTKLRALEQKAENTPFHTGIFWRATKGETELTIFGTYHFRHAQTDQQIAALLPFARAADTVWFEMNHDDLNRFEKLGTSDPSLMFITDGPTIPEIMDEADWQRLLTRAAALGIPFFMAAKFKPIFLAMMLGSSPCQMRAQALGDKGIDAKLARLLDAEGLDTRSIEDATTLMTLLDSFSPAEQVAMIKLSLDLPQDPDDLQATLLALYQEGKVALLWEYGRMLSLEHGGPSAESDFDRFEQALLTGRNRNWVETITTEVTGTHAFIAVGAGHLPGHNGLLNLLAESGFTIQRLTLN